MVTSIRHQWASRIIDLGLLSRSARRHSSAIRSNNRNSRTGRSERRLGGGHSHCCRWTRITSLAAAGAVGLGFGFAAAASTAHATALPSTAITVDGSRSGPVFDGVGAISGGGGNSRYLIDYPAAQRDAILDYLFKPNYGAALQVLKLEIGGDANSTDGAEQSAEHSHGQINCGTGYEWWMAEQAVARNPAIKLAGLQWAAPGWVADSYGGIWSSADRGYLIDWLGCAKQHGLAISYIGGWNERYNPQTAPGGSKRCGPRLTQTATAAFRSSRLIRTPRHRCARHLRLPDAGVHLQLNRNGAGLGEATVGV